MTHERTSQEPSVCPILLLNLCALSLTPNTANSHAFHAPSERLNRHQRAVALLALEAGKTLTDAAKAAGWKAQKTVTRLIRRFHERGLAALDDLPRSGHPRSYGSTERTRIVQELRISFRR